VIASGFKCDQECQQKWQFKYLSISAGQHKPVQIVFGALATIVPSFNNLNYNKMKKFSTC